MPKLADVASVNLLADMRINQLQVTRRQIVSAPRRTGLASGLQARLAPLRRGYHRSRLRNHATPSIHGLDPETLQTASETAP